VLAAVQRAADGASLPALPVAVLLHDLVEALVFSDALEVFCLDRGIAVKGEKELGHREFFPC
jgi:hypothetical protein